MKADTTTTIYLESRDLAAGWSRVTRMESRLGTLGIWQRWQRGRDRKENRVERKVGRKASPARVDNYLAKGKGLEMGPVPTRRHEHVTTVARPATCRNNAGQLEEEQPTRTSSRRTATTPRKPRRVSREERWKRRRLISNIWMLVQNQLLATWCLGKFEVL